MSKIVLGFIENESNFENDFIHMFPSKVGGKPKWLSLVNVPTHDDIKCGSCGDAMPLLLQIYAPIDSFDYAYHRSIFVFCCRNFKCHKPHSSLPFKVIRSNTFQNSNFVVNNELIINKDNKSNENIILKKFNLIVCKVCGLRVNKPYDEFCCKKHSVIHKMNNDIKEANKKIQFGFPLFEIVVEDITHSINNSNGTACSKKMKPNYSIENKLLKEYEKKQIHDIKDNINDDELDQTAQSLLNDAYKYHDKTFKSFCNAMKDYPDQILRYSLNGTPLLASKKPLPLIPNCRYCNSQLRFEFQIMPQILNYINTNEMSLKSSKHNYFDSLEWGTLLIYTCSKSCFSSTGCYFEEFLVKQDYD